MAGHTEKNTDAFNVILRFLRAVSPTYGLKMIVHRLKGMGANVGAEANLMCILLEGILNVPAIKSSSFLNLK